MKKSTCGCCQPKESEAQVTCCCGTEACKCDEVCACGDCCKDNGCC